MNEKQVYVWDPLVRIFHWSLVLFFTIAYLSEDDFMSVHEFSGYVVLGLVGVRVIWGLVGSRYARFSDFVYRPSAILGYIKSLASQPRHYLGHNPAGGAMVLVLLVMISLTGWTGIKAEEAEAGEHAAVNISLISNAYADDDHERGDGNEVWEELHEASANLTVFFIFLHVAGVLASSLVHRENLLRAMITGYKQSKD